MRFRPNDVGFDSHKISLEYSALRVNSNIRTDLGWRLDDLSACERPIPGLGIGDGDGDRDRDGGRRRTLPYNSP